MKNSKNAKNAVNSDVSLWTFFRLSLKLKYDAIASYLGKTSTVMVAIFSAACILVLFFSSQNHINNFLILYDLDPNQMHYSGQKGVYIVEFYILTFLLRPLWESFIFRLISMCIRK